MQCESYEKNTKIHSPCGCPALLSNGMATSKFGTKRNALIVLIQLDQVKRWFLQRGCILLKEFTKDLLRPSRMFQHSVGKAFQAWPTTRCLIKWFFIPGPISEDLLTLKRHATDMNTGGSSKMTVPNVLRFSSAPSITPALCTQLSFTCMGRIIGEWIKLTRQTPMRRQMTPETLFLESKTC